MAFGQQKNPLNNQGIHSAADGNRTRKIQRFYAVCRLRVAFRVAYFRRWYFIYISVRVKFWRFYIELESSMYQTSSAPLSWLCQHAPLQWTVWCRVKVIPIPRTIIRVTCTSIPAVPAGASISVFVKQIPMVIYDTPLISRVSSIWSAVPPAVIILNPASVLLRNPGFHKFIRGAI